MLCLATPSNEARMNPSNIRGKREHERYVSLYMLATIVAESKRNDLYFQRNY